MFGYVTANTEKLSAEDREVYRRFYCGVCRSLKARLGTAAEAVLNFDLVFPALLLSGVYGEKPVERECRCVPHPVKKHVYYAGPLIDYAAEMNFILVYYKCLDDRNDDRSLTGAAEARLMKKKAEQIEKRYPRVCGKIRECLDELAAMEKRDEQNPDLPASCFGALMGEVFVYRQDEHAAALWQLGMELGRFIYIADAVMDLKSDIRKKRYNPLISSPGRDWSGTLEMLAARCAAAAEALDAGPYGGIVSNILYSGLWSKWAAHEKQNEKKRNRKHGKQTERTKTEDQQP